VGLGVDWATTAKLTSNPTAVTVMERRGAEVVGVLTCVWKTNDPDVAIDRLDRIIRTVNGRAEGGRARRLSQDASSEKYHCANVRKKFHGVVIVEDVVAGETVERPGAEPITRKALLGNQLVGVLDDNQATLPPERYLKADFRLVKRDRGSFTTELGPNGEHGDTFDSHKLALNSLESTSGGPVSYEPVARPRNRREVV
jgi:hypothetical protein